jgi:hypothetical protein
MRDIRSDLLERAKVIEEQIRASYAHFERMVEQLRNEHDARVADLKASLAMIAKLMEFEERHMAATPPSSPQQADLAKAANKLRQVI